MTSFTERSGTSFTLCDLITVWTRVGHDPLAQITEGLLHPVEPGESSLCLLHRLKQKS
jgi:hypothetical protein